MIVENSPAPKVYVMRDLARLLNRSVPSLARDLSAGRLPSGFRIGRARRWLREEIDSWLAAGCPVRREWEAIRKVRK